MVDRAASRSPRRSDEGVLWPVRIRYAKEGPARFLSHLETGTILERAFRMAEIPVGHSLGHSPHPRFHFGPPLSVGVGSTAERIDVELQVPWGRDFIEQAQRGPPGRLPLDRRARPPRARRDEAQEPERGGHPRRLRGGPVAPRRGAARADRRGLSTLHRGGALGGAQVAGACAGRDGAEELGGDLRSLPGAAGVDARHAHGRLEARLPRARVGRGTPRDCG